MSIYKVNEGKNYFKGNRMQPAIIQFTTTIILIVLFCVFTKWWIALSAALNFLYFYSLEQPEINSYLAKVIFYSDCLHKRLPKNFDQINKLYGFSEGFHHWNSARIGWRCIDGVNIELFAYAYVNGERIQKQMIKVRVEDTILCCIQKKIGKYVFKANQLNGQSITVSIDIPRKFTFYSLFKLFIYRLYPYFGGAIPAPQNMSICVIKI